MSELTDYLNAAKDKHGLTIRAVADAARVSPTTVQNFLTGKTRKPDEDTLRAVAVALRLSGDRAVELAGLERVEPFLLPVEADLLDDDERAAVVHVVRQFLVSSGKVPSPKQAGVEAPSGTERVKRAARLRPRRADTARPDADS